MFALHLATHPGSRVAATQHWIGLSMATYTGSNTLAVSRGNGYTPSRQACDGDNCDAVFQSDSLLVSTQAHESLSVMGVALLFMQHNYLCLHLLRHLYRVHAVNGCLFWCCSSALLSHDGASKEYEVLSTDITSSYPIRFAVRSLGWVPIAEDQLTQENSSRAVNQCIISLSSGHRDINDVVGKWGDVSFYTSFLLLMHCS